MSVSDIRGLESEGGVGKPERAFGLFDQNLGVGRHAGLQFS